MTNLPARLDQPNRRVSICCQCGNIRDVSANHYPRGGNAITGEDLDPPEHVAKMRELMPDNHYWLQREQNPGVRCVELLKCLPCGKVTRHAYIRQGEYRNIAEGEQRRADRQRAIDSRRTTEALIEDFKMMGVRVYWRPLSGDRAVSIEQYLDDGAWVLGIDPDVDTERIYTALVHAWDAFLEQDERTWYAYPADDGAPPYRGIAFRGATS